VHVRPLRQPHATGENQPSDPLHTPQPAGGCSSPPDHRPPLAGIKLVRPRPRLTARRCGRSSLTPDRATAHTGSHEESHNHSPPPARRPPRSPGHPAYALDSGGPHGCGNRTQRDAVRRNPAAWHAEGQGFESPQLHNFSRACSMKQNQTTGSGSWADLRKRSACSAVSHAEGQGQDVAGLVDPIRVARAQDSSRRG